ncbi:MAG: acyl-CoA dehydrogenase [Rhodospirillaceae bacterium]
MLTLTFFAAGLVICAALAYHRCAAKAWIAALATLLALATWVCGVSVGTGLMWGILALAAFLFHPGPVRRAVISAPLLKQFRRALPQLSASERDALEAGTVWWDGEILGGHPDWRRMRELPATRLTPEEQAFLDGPVEELCEMLDEWRISRELHDLPPEAWAHIKRTGLLGMIIPKAYGGLGFSAIAHSEVIMKLTTRSSTAAVSVMVPNSLGPAELLLNYGTQSQKDYYLPRLARGVEIPCFALTSPHAGSDAGAIPDFGVVCRGEWQGERGVLGIRLTWEKRYITLGPIATLLGLAFQLYDPDRLIGPRYDVGITLALIPAATPGVHIGRRHLAMDGAFMTGPNWGKDVFVPMSFVIGGVDRVGQGWAMLMNCLAAGRSISLPANSCGVAKLCALTAGAYSRVRRQFGVPIGRFEGIQAVLARIAGNTYIVDAARRVTAAAVDAGERPSVISAVAKCHLTERVRTIVNDAMDIHGGKAICIGPSNYLAQAYQQVPIAITVEGANILMRSMIIFGQGVVRGHPYLLREMAAGSEEDEARARRDFDGALFGHLRFFVSNAVRTWWLGLTDARWLAVPGDPMTRRYYARYTRFSSALAFVSDVVLATSGRELKRRERISARLGDVLSLVYLGACVLKRYEDDGSPAGDLPLLQWSLADTSCRIEAAFIALFDNLQPAWLGRLLNAIVFPRSSREFRDASDRLDAEVARSVLEPGPVRERLTHGVFVSRNPEDSVRTLEAALRAVIAAEPIEMRMRASSPSSSVPFADEERRVQEAMAAGAISKDEADTLRRASQFRREVIMVDDFPRDLGPTEVYRTTQPVTFESLEMKDSAIR